MASLSLTRRALLALPAAAWAARADARTWLARFSAASSRASTPGLQVNKRWTGNFCQLSVTNRSKTPCRVGDVIAFDLRHELPGDTPFYGEGYQMLSQTGGTIAKPAALGNYTDAKHYKLPEPADAITAYNLIQAGTLLAAFTSCRRFTGKFYLRPETLEVAIDTEGLTLAPGQSLALEEFGVFGSGAHGELAARIAKHHPPIFPKEPPQGWCSWYCFGPKVTAEQVVENLDFIAGNMPSLRYIQIDDGYQPAMGDWLETGQAFGGNVQNVLKQIRDKGFEPAIWVAPFIAEAGSNLFRAHPDWFMKDDEGKPLAADKVTFGGWRRGPWYAVDGTHPEARAHLESVFRTMRNDWGVTYFKLDANFWGTMPGGRLHDPKATRVEAYRRAMEAIRRGTGDAFILGCNHPLWPSLGLIHGSRSSNDISRTWARFKTVALQNLQRGWQNGRLWWNDPDVVELAGKLSDDEFHFHAASIYASGGMLLSGDDLPRLMPERLEMLRKMSPPTGECAKFNPDFSVGKLRNMTFYFNWTDTASRIAAGGKDFWSGETIPANADLPPHSARILLA